MVQHQMNGVSVRISGDDPEQILGELARRAVRCDLRKRPPRLRPHAVEGIGRSAALIFAIAAVRSAQAARTGRGEQSSACSTTGFSSMHITGSFFESGFS